jgi:hypothetical protein
MIVSAPYQAVLPAVVGLYSRTVYVPGLNVSPENTVTYPPPVGNVIGCVAKVLAGKIVV